MSKECYIDECTNKAWAAGLCSKHYNRKRATGTTDDGPRARAPLSVRIWRYIDKRGDYECWPWTGGSKIEGYGVIGRGGRNDRKILAHRAVYELANGGIPEEAGEDPGYHGTVVMHTCDNRLCCNPAHLRAATQGDNVKDMDDKGRRKSTNPWPTRGLDPEKVRAAALKSWETRRAGGTVTGVFDSDKARAAAFKGWEKRRAEGRVHEVAMKILATKRLKEEPQK